MDAETRLRWRSVPAHRRLSSSRLKALDTVVIYAETSHPWMIAAYACWRQGFTVGTIYATLGEEGALFGINQSKCKAVVRQHADGGLLVAPQLTTPASWG